MEFYWIKNYRTSANSHASNKIYGGGDNRKQVRALFGFKATSAVLQELQGVLVSPADDSFVTQSQYDSNHTFIPFVHLF